MIKPPILTRPFLLVSLASLAYFVADGTSLALVARFATGPLGADALGAGLTYGAFSLSALVLRPLSGRLADRNGRRPLMVGGSLLFGAVMLAHLLAGSLAILVALRLLLGVAEALVFVAAFAAEADLAPPERRGEALTFFSLSLYAGVAVGPLIGEAAFGAGGFPAVWIASAGVAGIAALLALAVPETRPAGEAGTVASGRLLHPAGILPGLILMTGVWGMGGYFTLMPPYVVGPLGLDGARLFLLTFGGTVIVARLLGARLPDRLGARRLSGTALLITAAGLGLMGVLPTVSGLLAGTLLLGLGVAFTTPALASLTVSRAPSNERGAALGTFSAFIDLAFGLGPIAMGGVAAASTTPVAFLSAAAVALLGAAILWRWLEEAKPA
ncbi:MAG TPA: MFS transporter [Candidatus Limnocylindria bacterium]|nr:MFS transporter [Candidatus Limnocylindria bacterium]